jgi:DNA mismatch endonuclease, patch repair protein
VDRIDKKRRSWNMGRIKGRDTAPEVQVRSILHGAGYRFRLHRKDLPGRPDIVLPKHKTAIFVHGCFWHRHKGCSNCSTPKSNVEFWEAKFSGNVERDSRNLKKLTESGWKVIVVWECELLRPDELKTRLLSLLGPQKASSAPREGR